MHRLVLAGLWLIGSLAWIQADRMVRDGDEEGHVGAAELFLQQLRSGELLAFMDDAWRGQLGEYPPLVPALTGAWWKLMGEGAPESLAVRSVGLGSLLLTAWALGQLAHRHDDGRGHAVTAAVGFVLCLPLANGVARHFMPEAPLMAAVALAVWAAVRAGERPSWGRAAFLGGVLGLGLLVKQTFVLTAALPVLVALRRPRLPWLASGLVALVVAGPWYLRHLDAQLRYGSESAGRSGELTLLGEALYYPAATAWAGWGPVLTLGVIGGVAWALRERRARALLLPAAWFLGGMLILALIPKKYPRLLLPLLPAGGLVVAVAAARLRRPWLALIPGLLAAGGWLIFTSVRTLPPPAVVDALDPGCTQLWLRAPIDDDLGLGEVIAAVREAPPGRVAVQRAPEIPCAVQTTHGWFHHLGPALRRAGVERELFEGRDLGAALQLTWLGPGADTSGLSGDAVFIELLDATLHIETRPR